MASLYEDPSSTSPTFPLPIHPERIRSLIATPLLRLHQNGLPSWYAQMEECIGKLLDVGGQVSQLANAYEARHKIYAISEVIRPFDAMNLILRTHLVRGPRDEINRRYDIAGLSLMLELVDSWLRSCEEYLRRNNNKRIQGDVAAFDDASRELRAIAKPHLNSNCRHHDNLLELFDNLGLTRPDGLEDHEA